MKTAVAWAHEPEFEAFPGAAALETASPTGVIAQALASFHGRIAAVSSFGTESAVLLSLIAEVDKSTPILFLDTGYLFDETLAYRDALVARLKLTDVRTLRPDPAEAAEKDPENALWAENPDACCALRKVVPLARALKPFDAWINGRKRYHGDMRAAMPVVEHDGERVKINPMARMSREQIVAHFRAHDLPRHPLEAKGFLSIGCMPCTSRSAPGDELRSGRWRGRGKTECGIHTASLSAAVK
ncbi:MAG: phosphoadenylyl-sulfate reductase [Hyphomicrobiales bacterium]|nr:phosphoadenylyl-sulfate reductase [Hyphomicrobiales bacterium]